MCGRHSHAIQEVALGKIRLSISCFRKVVLCFLFVKANLVKFQEVRDSV